MEPESVSTLFLQLLVQARGIFLSDIANVSLSWHKHVWVGACDCFSILPSRK